MRGIGGTLSGNFGNAKSDYEQARNSHLRRPRTGVPLTGASADWHIRSEQHWLTLVELPRALDRDSPVIRQGLNRVCDKVAGSRFHLHSDTGDEDVNNAIEAEINDWANDSDLCDAQGHRTLQEMAWQVLRHRELDGDCFAIPLEEGCLATYEAHRFRSSTRSKFTGTHGIEVNEFGRATKYFLTRGDIGFNPTVTLSQIDGIPAYDENGIRQVFHLYNPERFTTRRGISVMAPILDVTSYHDDTTFATCIANQLQTFFAIIHEYDQSQGSRDMPSMKGGDAKKGEQSLESLPDGTTALIEKVFGPIEYFAKVRGEKIRGFSPTFPGVQFTPFMLHLLGLIACNLGIPLAVLLLDARPELTGSYSSWRGAQNEAREGYRKKQKWLIDHFYSPVYRWQLRRLIAKGGVFAKYAEKLGPNFFKHEWKPPAWLHIDPVKDTASDLVKMETGQCSIERVFADNGLDFKPETETWAKNRAFQIVTAITAVEEINKQFPKLDDKPTWRDCFPLVGGQAGANLIAMSHQADDPPPPAKTPEPTPARKPSEI